ncbi:hypothetical protein MKX01_005661 [Papaver californicum]|nr:hypothetical protein MKX01_005661 [Papaver californicum]
MGKIVEEKPKKKKGRPSLLDLQKRRLLQQQQDQQKLQKQNPNFRNILNSNSDNINNNCDGKNDGDEDDEDYEEDGNGKRKEKKLKFVVKLPNSQQQQQRQNPFLNTNSYNSESNLLLDDGNGENPYKKRKINDVVGDGSAQLFDQTGEKHSFNFNSTSNTHQGLPLESGPTTPLPDKKLLFFILDRLQKKDTYSVFSEPVDPDELPDYFEIIQHPMDFGTIRKKLEVGAYASLEQFEKDVFLICSNAMEYNAPDTIYFRQARSIKELAKKDFENLRQDNNGPEAQPRVVRRGRPPKHLKKAEIFSDAALATGVDNSIFLNSYNLRKGPVSISNDTPTKTRYKEASWSTERKWDRNDDFSGMTFKAMSMKIGKKQIILDENRRNTYFLQPGGGCEPSIYAIFDDEEKQLMHVGVHVERGYAESMARFAANLGPVAWKVAAKKISRTLPAGTNFGPGWVEEKEIVPAHLQMPLSMSSPQRPPPHPQQQLFSVSQISPSATTSLMEVKGDKLLDNHEFLDGLRSDMHPNRSLPSSSTSVPSSIFMNRAPESIIEHQMSAVKGPQTGFDSMNTSSSSGIKHSHFQIHQNPVMPTVLNGFTGGFGYNPANQMAKHWQTGLFSSEGSARIPDVLSGSNNLAHSVAMNHFQSEEHRFLAPSGIASPMNFNMSLSGTHNNEAPTVSGNTGIIHMHPLIQHQQKQISVPPDLNVMFQLPSSPNPNIQGDSPQPDLALQL